METDQAEVRARLMTVTKMAISSSHSVWRGCSFVAAKISPSMGSSSQHNGELFYPANGGKGSVNAVQPRAVDSTPNDGVSGREDGS